MASQRQRWHMKPSRWPRLCLLLSTAQFFFKNYFQLEDNCFSILCWFLPYNNMNQPWVHICPLPPEPPPPFTTPSYPSRLSQSTGLSSLCHTANFHCTASTFSAHLSELQFSRPGVLDWFLANLLSLLEKKLICLHGLKCCLYDPKLIFIAKISSMNSRLRNFNWELNNLNWFYVDILNLAHNNQSDLLKI